MLQPPVSTPTERMMPIARSRIFWYSRSVSVVAGVADDGLGALAAELLDDLLEALAVLTAVDRLDAGADQLDAVLLEYAVGVELDRAVEGGLPSQRGQQRVGPLDGDDLLDILG